MVEIFQSIPQELIHFLLVVLFSFSIGMEQHKVNSQDAEKRTFGTDRTFTFIGLFGYIMLLAAPQELLPFLVGLVLLGCFLMIYYFMKIQKDGKFGMTTVLLGMIVYTFPLVIVRSPLWISLLFFVAVLILTEIKKPLQRINGKVAQDEFLTLAKFIIIAGIVLPLLPNEEISPYLNVTPYKVWLAIVVVSGISYLSYLLRRYIFPKAGLLLTGILGGLYSSTASTIILSRKSKEKGSESRMYAGAILMATAMMYFRIFVLLLIFNQPIALVSLPYFVILFVVSFVVGFLIYKSEHRTGKRHPFIEMEDKNPLEFKIAVVFAGLYILFSALTEYAISNFGSRGLSTLSVIVGFTDIDPFLLNLFQGKYNVAIIAVLIATMQSIISNNLLKAVYAWIFGERRTAKWVSIGLGCIVFANVILLLILYLS